MQTSSAFIFRSELSLFYEIHCPHVCRTPSNPLILHTERFHVVTALARIMCSKFFCDYLTVNCQMALFLVGSNAAVFLVNFCNYIREEVFLYGN